MVQSCAYFGPYYHAVLRRDYNLSPPRRRAEALRVEPRLRDITKGPRWEALFIHF